MNLYGVTIALFTFIFGVVIGSFLNVVIYRFRSGMHLGGRSKCLSCGKTLKVCMLIPLFSYLLQGGRCGFCSAKLSPQYPAVELAAGLLFIMVGAKNGLFSSLVSSPHILIAFSDMAIWSLLLSITVYDWKHKIIPDRFSLLFAILAALDMFLKIHFSMLALPYLPFLDVTPGWINWAAAPLCAIPFALLWLFSGGRAMGLGDAKLAWGIGWFLGFASGVTALIFSFWIAFFPSLILLFLRGKRFTMKSEIPFAPFLVLGTLVVYMLGIDILNWTF